MMDEQIFEEDLTAAENPEATDGPGEDLCKQIAVGTTEGGNDIVNAGIIQTNFLTATQLFESGSNSANIFIEGPIALQEQPLVYPVGSGDSSDESIVAYTSQQTAKNIVKLDVNYECTGPSEDGRVSKQTFPMQLDLAFANDCGLLQPQWLVICSQQVEFTATDSV